MYAFMSFMSTTESDGLEMSTQRLPWTDIKLARCCLFGRLMLLFCRYRDTSCGMTSVPGNMPYNDGRKGRNKQNSST